MGACRSNLVDSRHLEPRHQRAQRHAERGDARDSSPWKPERARKRSRNSRCGGGQPSRVARDEAVRDGITINGLPILSVEADLDTYYFENVIGGPGAIMVYRRTAMKALPKPS